MMSRVGGERRFTLTGATSRARGMLCGTVFCSIVSCVGVLASFGCSSDEDGISKDRATPAGDSQGSLNGGAQDAEDDSGLDGGVGSLPEEIEDEVSYRAPVATGHYLWSTNPESGRVALVDVRDLSVRVLAAGLYPTFLTSTNRGNDEARAIVLNSGSSDATRFVVNGSDVKTESIATHVGANRWSVSASGRFAVAWTQAERGEVLDPTEGLQEITVIDLAEKEMVATRLTVGYRPSQLRVSADDEVLVVVSEEDITLIDLVGVPSRTRRIDLGFEAELRDVSLSEDGFTALVRRSGLSTVDLVSLNTSQDPIELQFSGPVTDVDLAPSGRAVAIIRQNQEFVTFELSEVLDDPTQIESVVIEDELFGSVVLSEDGKRAVVYTNAAENSRVSIVNLGDEDFLSYRSLSTQSPVYSVMTTKDGKHAAVVGGNGAGAPGDAFSLVSLDTERFARIEGTSAPVAQVALGNSAGLITASSTEKDVFEAHLVRFPSLSVKRVALSTEPLSAGVLAEEGLAYAAQVHPEGRVTFFDLENYEPRTLTGYELSADVVDK